MTRSQKEADEELERNGFILKKHVQPPPASQYVFRPRATRLRRAEPSPSITMPPPKSHYVSKPRTQYTRRAQTTASVPARVWKGAMPTSSVYKQLPGLSGPAMQQQQQPDRGAVAAPSSLSSAAAGHAASLPSSSMVRPPPDCDLQIGAGGIDLSTSSHHHQGSSERSASGSQPRAPSSTIRKTQDGGPQLSSASAHAAATSTSLTTKALMAESPVKGSSSVAFAVTPGEEARLGEGECEGDRGRTAASSSVEKSYAPASIQIKAGVKRKASQGEEDQRDEEESKPGSEVGVGNPRNTSGRNLRSGKMSVKKAGSEDEVDKGDGPRAGRAGNASTSSRSPTGSRKRSKTGAEVGKKMKAEHERGDASSSSSTMGMRLRTALQRKKPAKLDC